jgi:Protein of unknown function (DUF1588)/Protein of unknown function (DUF1592)
MKNQSTLYRRLIIQIVTSLMVLSSLVLFQNCSGGKFEMQSNSNSDSQPIAKKEIANDFLAIAEKACSGTASRACETGEGTGIRSCISGQLSPCQVAACRSGYVLRNGRCEPVKCTAGETADCTVRNGTGLRTCNEKKGRFRSCVINACLPGYVLTKRGNCVLMACSPGESIACPVENGTGMQTCSASGSVYESCVTKSCNAGFIPKDGLCQPTLCTPNTSMACVEGNGMGTKTCNVLGTAYDACQINSCKTGFRFLNGMCIQSACEAGSSVACQIGSGTGSKKCNSAGSGYDECVLTGCIPGFLFQNGMCLAQVCKAGSEAPCVEGSVSGTKACNATGTAYGACVPTAPTCQVGSKMECTLGNGIGVRVCQQDGRTFGGCEINACLPGFILTAEKTCVPMACRPGESIGCAVTNGSGLQKCNALGSGYEACSATSCNTGFIPQNGSCQAQACAPGSKLGCEDGSGIGQKTCNSMGSGYGMCVISSCKAGFYPSNGVCLQSACQAGSSVSCTIGNGIGTKKCNATTSGYEPCVITGCSAGFVFKNGMCIAQICVAGAKTSCSEGGVVGLKTCSADGTSYGVCEPGTMGSIFEAAKGVLSKNCTACHYEGSQVGKIVYATESEFKSAGLVVAGNLAQSKLIYRLKKYPENIAGRTMPQGSDITDEEYAILSTWVKQMTPDPVVNRNANVFTCDPAEQAEGLDARRLARIEYYNTMLGLLTRPFGATEAAQILNADPNTFWNKYPQDAYAPFTRSDQLITSRHSKSYFDIANEVANAATTDARINRLITTFVGYSPGKCVSASATSMSIDCLEAFTKNFALRAWGRPIEVGSLNLNDEWASLTKSFTVGANPKEIINNLVFRILVAPSFTTQVYLDGVLSATNSMQLSNFAIARRLSFQFMRSNLDENLINLALTQDLKTDAGFANALNYVSQRAKPMIAEFSEEWLALYKMPKPLTPPTSKLSYISNGITVDSNLTSAMKSEIIELMTYIYDSARPASEILTSTVSFARDPNLLKLYGLTTPAPAVVSESNAIRFPASHGRSGVPSRAAYLLSPTDSEKPIARAIHIREQFLCAEVKGTPPPNATSTPLPTGNLTTREKIQAITSSSACIGCHASINPVGYAYGQFNALGGYQMAEPIFQNNVFSTQLTADPSVDLTPVFGLSLTTKNAAEFNSQIAESPEFKRCFSQHYKTFASALPTRTKTLNSCDMQRMFEVLAQGGTLQQFFKASATGKNYRGRQVLK